MTLSITHPKNQEKCVLFGIEGLNPSDNYTGILSIKTDDGAWVEVHCEMNWYLSPHDRDVVDIFEEWSEHDRICLLENPSSSKMRSVEDKVENGGVEGFDMDMDIVVVRKDVREFTSGFHKEVLMGGIDIIEDEYLYSCFHDRLFDIHFWRKDNVPVTRELDDMDEVAGEYRDDVSAVVAADKI